MPRRYVTACYGPSVISVTVTKGEHPRGNRLYGTSGTIGRGVAESRKSLVYKNVGMWKHTQCINVLTHRRT